MIKPVYRDMKTKGFTLIEVLFALIILAGFAISFSDIWFGNSKRIKMGRIHDTAIHLMEEKMGELELEWSKLNFRAIPKENKGEFKEEAGFSWSFKTQPLQMPSPETFLDPQADNNELSLKVINEGIQYFSKSILEAQVTVHFKGEDMQSSWSVTTYIADPNSIIDLPL